MDDVVEYMGYYGRVHYSAKDFIFYGHVLCIDDLIYFEGNTVKRLITSFQKAVDDYLWTCKQLNREPSKTYSGTFQVRVPPDMHKAAGNRAASLGGSLNDFVKNAIQEALKKR